MGTLHFIPTAVIAAQFTAVLPFPFVTEIVAVIARIIFIIVNHLINLPYIGKNCQFARRNGFSIVKDATFAAFPLAAHFFYEPGSFYSFYSFYFFHFYLLIKSGGVGILGFSFYTKRFCSAHNSGAYFYASQPTAVRQPSRRTLGLNLPSHLQSFCRNKGSTQNYHLRLKI